MKSKNVSVAAWLIAGLGLVSSCQKDVAEKKVDPPAPSTAPTPTLTDTQLKDSILIYSRDLYLWYKQIPSTFDPQTYADPNAVMTAFRAYSTETGYGAPVDRWSYAIKKSEWDNLSMGLNLAADPTTQNLGLQVFFRAQDDLRVRLVEKESPAGLAGIRRGWRITRINGSGNMTTGNANFILAAVNQGASSTFTFQKPDRSSVDITLKAASYRDQPLLLDTVYNAGSKKTGYLVFNSFLGDTGRIYSDLQRVFNRFSQQQVNELIVDLRYNGGGYVNVQEKLANYLINSAYNGQVMMSEQFNDKHIRYNTTKKFVKMGSLNVSRISFIVSNNTASASELLINNLKPYMDVRLVGPSKTHGKPVGFFPVPVGDWYIFPISFRSVNKNGEGNYFNGLSLTNQVADGLDKDWGDINESALAFILNRLKAGSYRTGTTESLVDPRIEDANSVLSANEFRGSVDTR